ncbi:MAG: hypothetical protein IKW67_00945, partial [Alphaproteobacteria bacterium]|nr:hypothetical protein [Alphaproteobacteria bacterium]
VSDKNFTLGNVAQACLDYTTINDKITAEICKKFMNDIIGETHLTDLTRTFVATTTSDTTEFKFHIYAAGNYTVDCGDEKPVQKISITDAKTGQEITCKYSKPDAYKIIIGGRATGYDNSVPAISFEANQNLAGIDGSLGAIFPTLNKSQPIFYLTFSDCTNLKGSIPANLFSGIQGAPADSMFNGTFFGCSGLNGSIPENLFSGISGAPAEGMFAGTFHSCSGLTGPIPANLFSGIQRVPAEYMFFATFYGCSGLKGSIPENLFSGISGAPAEGMFAGTFLRCSGLTGPIPANLFRGISGAPAREMFAYTFGDCSGLSGSIPANLFSGIQGAPAEYMFSGTFSSCSGLSGDVTEKFFGDITDGVTAGDVEDWETFDGTQITFK